MESPSWCSQVALHAHRRNRLLLPLAAFSLLAALFVMGGARPAFATTTVSQSCSTATGHSISTTSGVTTETFDSQVGDCVWAAPAGVTSITVEAFGAQGGHGYRYTTASFSNAGNNGWEVYSPAISVTAGNSYVVEVGGQGLDGVSSNGLGGFATGGRGTGLAGGGGGGTFFWAGTSTPPPSVLVAAGGGGGGLETESAYTSGGGGGGGSNNTGAYLTGADGVSNGGQGADGVAYVSGTGTPSTGCPALPTPPTSVCASSGRQSLGGYMIITYTQTISATTTTLASSASGTPPNYMSVYGQPFTLTATVSPDPTVDSGSVEFQYSTDSGSTWNDITNCGDVTSLTGNGTTATATCDVSVANGNLAGFDASATAYEFQAIYTDTAAMPGFTSSTSDPINQTISAAGTTVSLSSSPNPTVYGQPFTVSATVTASSPATIDPTTGKVTFLVDGNPLYCEESTNGYPYNVVDVTAGPPTTATCTVDEYYQLEDLHAGNHTITAQFVTDDANYNNSPVASLTQAINPASTTTTASATYDNLTSGGVASITATVTINPPSILSFSPLVGLYNVNRGTVSFFNGATLLCTVPLDEWGHAVCVSKIDPATVPPHTLTAIYNYDGSDPDFLASSGTTTGNVTTLSTPTIVTMVNAYGTTNPALLLTGGGFTGTTSVTVCGIPVPFTIVNDYTMLIGEPTFTINTSCIIVVSAAGGTGSSATFLIVGTPPPGPVNVGPGGTPAPACNVFTLTLSGQWTLIAWPGASTPVGQALAASADGCTNDVTAKVAVIWGYDAATQTWHAYFPTASGIPGANDLATLEQGMGYFVALVDPTQSVSWKAEVGS